MRKLAVFASVACLIGAQPAFSQMTGSAGYDNATMVQTAAGWKCKTAGWVKKTRKTGNNSLTYCVKGVSSGGGVKKSPGGSPN